MFTNELEIFHRPPGVVQSMRCRVCGAVCAVTRNACGPTCFAAALARRSTLHDRFTCPRAAEPWHGQARQLVSAIQSAPSRWLAALMKLELALLLLQRYARKEVTL